MATAAAPARPGAHAAGRIGPNAVIQVAAALRAAHGDAATMRVLAAAGLAGYAAAPPEAMIDEGEVTALHGALHRLLGTAAARAIGRAAGTGTADYLLAHRIPAPGQAALRLLPAALASRALLAAIRRHAWTFAGSGRFGAAPGRPLLLTIAGGPIARALHAREPICDFYAATFARLWQALVSPRAQAIETACEAAGAAACTFALRW